MNSQQRTIPLINWWIVWLALQVGIFVIYFVLEKSSRENKGPEFPIWLAGFLPLIGSAIIRWMVLPRISVIQTAFPLFVVGIAMAEGATFFGMFLFPEQKQLFFLLSVVGMFQFIPTFAKRFYKSPEDESKFR